MNKKAVLKVVRNLKVEEQKEKLSGKDGENGKARNLILTEIYISHLP
ncbi:MAG: hypothetical protein ACO2PO_16520 [Candidatus Calescibacterium sp.]|jgi:hypothetical protein